MISRKRKLIFIRNPKTASTTIVYYLLKHAHALHGDRISGLPVMREKGLAQVINLYPTHFTFTFVRNPFDRFISFYLDGLRQHKDSGTFMPYRNVHECAEFAVELIDNLDLHHKSLRKIGPRQVAFYQLYWERHHVRRQVDFLLDQHPHKYFGVTRFNQEPCSFIGRYENFMEDFSCLLDIIGIPHHPIESWNVSPERLDATGKKRHYSTYYDKSTQAMVEKIYARDLAVLDYEFEQEGRISHRPYPLFDKELAQSRYEQKIEITWYRQLELHIKRVGTYFNMILVHRIRKQIYRGLILLRGIIRERWPRGEYFIKRVVSSASPSEGED